MEKKRPLELIGQVGADARLDSGPRIAAISRRPRPHTAGARANREQDIEKAGKRDVRNHWGQ
jgi:hypothetical protein